MEKGQNMNYCLYYQVTLKNLQIAKIHLKYKERPKFNTMPPNEKERHKFFRQEFYGLSENLSGQMGKFSLILKDSFDIVSFKDDFLIRNEMQENRMRESKILRKNWNEVCYVYDDYDIHYANFEIKAVGLGPFSFFNSCSTGFYMGKDIEIISLEINGKKSKFEYNNYCLDYNVKLKNLQTAKIYLKYKERPKFNTMSPDEKEIYKFYRQEFYGLSENLSG